MSSEIPTMVEVEAVADTGYGLVSTFSGCGGSCLGFRMAGYRTLWANEFVDAARETYEANHPGVPVSPADIRTITADDILTVAGKKAGEVDVLEGSPPCASFSMAGSREKAWGKVKGYSDTEQRVDDLFFEFIRILDGIRPRVFVAENVSGLVRGVAKGYFKEILRAMRKTGYQVEAQLLDASWLGVAQARKRLIFVGTREDMPPPVFPAPFPRQTTMRDVLPDLVSVSGRTGPGFVRVDHPATQPAPTILASDRHTRFEVTAPGELRDPETGTNLSIERFAIGPEWRKLRPGGQSSRYFQLVRSDPSKPVGTITATGGNIGAAGVTHPYEPRKFNLIELRALSGFPADFRLTGSFEQRWERIGRSVPPLMMRAVAETIRDQILSVADGRA